MNTRVGLALAVGGGYVLGRTRKARLALGLGSMVLGKKLNITPAALRQYLTTQLRNNPHLEQIGAELRKDLGGAGKAAASALTTRQINGIADRLHSRTADLQGRLGSAVPGRGGRKDEDGAEDEDQDANLAAEDDDEVRDEEPADEPAEEPKQSRRTGGRSAGAAKQAGGGSAAKPARSAGKTAAKSASAAKSGGSAGKGAGGTARKTAAKTPARKTAAKAPARKTAARKETAGRRQPGKTTASGSSSRRSSSKREADRD